MTTTSTRRELLTSAAALAALGVGSVPAAAGALPWLSRFLHLYTGADGRTRVEVYPVRSPIGPDQDQLLRRTAERVSLGSSRAGAGWDLHVANQPTLLVPILGSIVVGLEDGTKHEFGHGDICFAEDCTGRGHTSHAGAEGCFIVQVQLAKSLCPAVGSSDMTAIWHD